MVTSKIFLRKYKVYEDGFIKRITPFEYVRFWILSFARLSKGQYPLVKAENSCGFMAIVY
jgi:hypothetical protein